jgi:hypothetical protein
MIEMTDEQRGHYRGLKEALAACEFIEALLRDQNLLERAAGALDVRNQVLMTVIHYEDLYGLGP